MAAASRSIATLLSAPSKVAGALDWRRASGSILSLTILKDKIQLAVSSHPELSEPLFQLPSIPLKQRTSNNRKTLDNCVVEELKRIVDDHQVCAYVVSWPVQKEGWCGAQCGRVLHTLDDLTAQSKTLLSKTRPICLWDEHHHVPPEDEWGRAAVYCTTSDKNEHRASTEQYADHETVAAKVWNDFCRVHWPELYQHKTRQLWEGGKSSRDNTLSAEESRSSQSHSWNFEITEGSSLNQARLHS